MRRVLSVACVMAAATAGAVTTIVACGPERATKTGYGAEAGAQDSTTFDAANDGRTGDVARSDAPAGDAVVGDGATTYHDMGSAAFWSAFDLSSVSETAVGFSGATFDGRNIYFAPLGSYVVSPSGTVARYDTAAPFASGTSWSIFDTSTVNVNAKPYIGAVYDGRYVYLVPVGLNPSLLSGFSPEYVVARYDTLAPFPAKSSWTMFDTPMSDAGTGTDAATDAGADAGADASTDAGYEAGATFLAGFSGATTDGRALYFGPLTGSTAATRYDLDGGFTTSSSWSEFDTRALGAGRSSGVVYDGRYVYFEDSWSGLVARVDTQAPFGAPGSWSTYNLGFTSTDTSPATATAAFDGRFVYFVGPAVIQYDTQMAFDDPCAWASFDTLEVPTTIDGGLLYGYYYASAVFDGRYLYLVPGVFYPLDDVLQSVVLRYDTEAPFLDQASWSAFDTSPLTPSPEYFGGAVFDGRYVYLVPLLDNAGPSGVVVRFDAKTPPSMPPLPQYHGSFR
jgi:hypothetical protein